MIWNFFFNSAGLISNMVVLIASHRFTLLLYCLPLLYNFIFTTKQIFNQVQIKTWEWPFHYILSSKSFLCSKNSQVSLDTWEGASPCINKYLTLKLWDWDLYYEKKNLVHKIAMSNTVPFNSFINFSSTHYHLFVALPSRLGL